jgi:hypothetical protein
MSHFSKGCVFLRLLFDELFVYPLYETVLDFSKELLFSSSYCVASVMLSHCKGIVLCISAFRKGV